MSVACLICRKNKKKCEGGHPCQRCVASGLDCTFPLVPRQPRTKLSVVKRKLNQIESLFHALNLDDMTPEQIEEKLKKNIEEGHMRFKQRIYFQNHLGEINIKPDGSYKKGTLSPEEHLSHYPSPEIHSISISFKEHLFNTYSRFIHPTLPFINLKRIHAFQIDNEQEFCSPLLDAIYCRSFRYLQQSKSPGKIPPLEEDHFYRRCLQSLDRIPPTSPTLDSVQAEILISLEEFGQSLIKVSARRLSKILSNSHMLSLHDPASLVFQFETESMASDDMDTGDNVCNITKKIDLRFEKFTTWVAGVFVDSFTSLFTKSYIHSAAQTFDCTQEIMFLENLSQQHGSHGTQGCSFAQSTNSYIKECSAFSFSSPGLSSDSLHEPMAQLGSECDAWIGRTHIYTLKLLPQYSFLMKRVLLIQRRLTREIINAKGLYDLQSELYEVSAAALNLMPPDFDHRVLSTTTLDDDSALVAKFLIYLIGHLIRLEAGNAMIHLSVLLSKMNNNFSVEGSIHLQPPSYANGSQSISILYNQGKALKILSGEFIIKGFTHSKPGYWLQFAPSIITLPTSIVLILMHSASDFSPESQSIYSWANANLDSYLAPWPLLGNTLLVEGQKRCNFAYPHEVSATHREKYPPSRWDGGSSSE